MANRGRHLKPITPEEIVAYFSFRGGASREEIAKVLNINFKTVSVWAKKVKKWLGKWADEEELKNQVKGAGLLMLPIALEGLRYKLEVEKDSGILQFYFKYFVGLTESTKVIGDKDNPIPIQIINHIPSKINE